MRNGERGKDRRLWGDWDRGWDTDLSQRSAFSPSRDDRCIRLSELHSHSIGSKFINRKRRREEETHHFDEITSHGTLERDERAGQGRVGQGRVRQGRVGHERQQSQLIEEQEMTATTHSLLV
jgi:hypothetical protein